MRTTFSTLFNAIRSLSLQQVFILLKTVLSYPLFAILSLYATIKTLLIINHKFPNAHSDSGRGNAYRHGLWCALIMTYCCKISSPKKSKKWCLKITTLHEDIFVNHPLDRKMDIHNNGIGIDLFISMLSGIHRQFFETSFIINKLDKKISYAQGISSFDQEFPNEFVYLEK